MEESKRLWNLEISEREDCSSMEGLLRTSWEVSESDEVLEPF